LAAKLVKSVESWKPVVEFFGSIVVILTIIYYLCGKMRREEILNEEWGERSEE